MARSLQELESLITEKGQVGREDLLKFVRLIPNSDKDTIVAILDDWLVRLEEVHAVTDIDAEWLEQIRNDFELHGRIQHETLIGAQPRPLFEKFRKAEDASN